MRQALRLLLKAIEQERTLIAVFKYLFVYLAFYMDKEYVVNMMNNRRTLHKNHNTKCYYSSGMYAFIPFNNLAEAELFQKEHNVAFCKCGNCFPKEGKK